MDTVYNVVTKLTAQQCCSLVGATKKRALILHNYYTLNESHGRDMSSSRKLIILKMHYHDHQMVTIDDH
jgi:hypothetical protein